MKTLVVTDKKIIQDAVELGKGNFIKLYSDQGHKEEYLQSVWHDLKMTSYARSISGRSNTRYEASEVEVKEAYKEASIDVKELTKEKEDPSDNPFKGDRREQVRQAFESGITSPAKIRDIIGGNSTYIGRLIKELGLK